MLTGLRTILVLLVASMPMTANAEFRALLIGIGQYPGNMRLEGPVNDVALVREVLLKSNNITSQNIVELLDEKATKINILEALDNLQQLSSAGDNVVLFFSGHGTSAHDLDIGGDIPINSGALVPYDIQGITDKAELNERLLLGTRDLRPVLKKFDNAGIKVLVLVDACYSGNVVRGKSHAHTLPTKFLDFSELLPALFVKEDSTPQFIQEAPELLQTVDYPYENVFLFAAAQEDQVASDIPAHMLEEIPTVDSKPHGAFTDSFVKVLLGLHTEVGDVNQISTLAELHSATRTLMKKRHFLSKPILLPYNIERTGAVELDVFFGQSYLSNRP